MCSNIPPSIAILVLSVYKIKLTLIFVPRFFFRLWFRQNLLIGVPDAIISPQGSGHFKMNNICEITISYSPKFKASDLPSVTSSKDAFKILKESWKNISYYETFKILLLNRANRVLGATTIGTGGISGVVADPKRIFQTALKANASSIILAHNHPSGNLNASQQDIALTKKIKQGADFLDISVLDHLIITDESYKSLADENLL